MPAGAEAAMWVGQKSRSDRDWKERDPPNRGRERFYENVRGTFESEQRGLGWGHAMPPQNVYMIIF